MPARRKTSDFMEEDVFARIKVVGIGGSGSHAVNRMLDSKIKGVEL
jgi:cell division GTPase FtsZ